MVIRPSVGSARKAPSRVTGRRRSAPVGAGRGSVEGRSRVGARRSPSTNRVAASHSESQRVELSRSQSTLVEAGRRPLTSVDAMVRMTRPSAGGDDPGTSNRTHRPGRRHGPLGQARRLNAAGLVFDVVDHVLSGHQPRASPAPGAASDVAKEETVLHRDTASRSLRHQHFLRGCEPGRAHRQLLLGQRGDATFP